MGQRLPDAHGLARRSALALVSALVACGPASQVHYGAKAPDTSIILIATERSSRGGRLVGVRADGARQYELTELRGDQTIIDRSPVSSPDGQTVVFVSNRGLSDISATSLWSVSIKGGEAKRLTQSGVVDRDPRFSPDGSWLYFCSNRAGSFDLYRARFARGELGPAQVVVQSEQQILSPSLSPDGRELVYMAVDGEGASRLWRALADGSGSPRMLTDGPLDMTPAWGADDTIAFAARAPGREDADLYLMAAVGGDRHRLVSTPLTDETGPRFSDDARYIFAVGMYRGADGKPILGSVIYFDRREDTPVYRALHDAAAVESRIGLALLPDSISPARLQDNPIYQEALRTVVLQEWLRNERARRSAEQEPDAPTSP